MKINLKTPLVPLLLCFFAFAFLGCNDEPSCPDASESTLYMTKYYNSFLPYSGLDTICFKTNFSDTLIYIGQGRITFFETEYVREPNPDCNVYHKKNYEGYSIRYGDLFTLRNSYLKNEITINNYTNLLKFKIYDIGSFSDGLHDSININNVIYYKVSEYKSANSELVILINREFGVIEIKDNISGKTYSIIRKN